MRVVEVDVRGHTMYELQDDAGRRLAGPDDIDMIEAAREREFERQAMDADFDDDDA